MNYARRRDANEPAIVKALQAVGATVVKLTGSGQPDLLVGWRGKTYLLEVKDPDMGARNSRTKHGHKTSTGMRETQERWWSAWKGLPPVLVTTPQDALAAIGATFDDKAGADKVPRETRSEVP